MQPSRDKVADPWLGKDVPALAAARRAARAIVSADTRFKLYFRILDTPVLSELYVRGRGRLRHRRVRPQTRIVIEAFPSSGNTYCRQAFLMCNPDVEPNDLCTHTHAPRVVERAVRLGVPCIVVARDPRDAVSSMVQRFSGIHIRSAFDYYDHYYRKLLPLRDEFVVAPFESMIHDFTTAVEACNDKYAVDFTTNAEAGVSSEMVFEDIERRARRKHGGVIREEGISRPSAARRPAAEFLRDMTDGERRAMDRAVETYRAFVGEALPAVQDTTDTGPAQPAV